ncbi:homoserine kinase [Psychrobacter sp. I-STPA6b]|uniref:homoserine kinase n=1 Tax=Psychrobacter sp. I-STPA6b TaxID=2585718 RepID=UPI001D0CADD4|nr:homoserine kinase [Psychrobacter sp. I-STPA6b]
MSVYTQLTTEQFRNFCQQFGVAFAKAIPITQGIKNSNWFIQTTEDKEGEYSYVFTLFEERKPHEIEKMAVILNQLKGQLPVASPLAKVNNPKEFVAYFDNKAITLVPKLSGTHPKVATIDMCEQMGEALAVLHQTLSTLTPAENYGVELYPWHLVRDRETQYMPADEARLMHDIWSAYEALPLASLPKGLCHLDMFADNTLWDFHSTPDTPKLTGLLDFTEVSVEHYVMDIAITINDFCTTWGNAEHGEKVEFDEAKKHAFLRGYQRQRPLTPAESKALPIMLAQASVIFWLLRLNVIYYNRQQGRTGDNIMVKNPDLMKRLASYHWEQVEKSQAQIQYVYLLQHLPDRDTDKEDMARLKIIGIFDSEQQAEMAVEQLKTQTGFKDYPNDFVIVKYAINELDWSEGFGGN